MNKALERIDRWLTAILIYLLPWQARLIFRAGALAGAPSEPQTVSLYAVEALIWLALAVRLAAMFAEAGGQPRRGRWYALSAAAAPLAAFGGLCALALYSVIISFDPGATVMAAVRLAEGLAVMFLAMSAPSPREARLAFVVSALVQSAIAVIEVSFQRVYPSSWLGLAAHFPGSAGASVVEAGGMRFLRAYGTLPHPNILGGMLAIAILSVRPLLRRVSWVGLATYAFLGIGLFLTFSRLAWIAALLGIAAQAAYARRDRIFTRQAPAALAAMAACALLVWPLVSARTTAAGRLERQSVAARTASYADAWKLFAKQPLSGVGAGAFTAAVHEQVDSKRSGFELEPAHSAPVEVAAEIGLFGLLLYAYFLLAASRLAWNSGRIGLAAALLCCASLDHWSWTTYAGIMFFCLGWGLVFRRGCEDGVTYKAGAVVLSHDDPSRVLLLYREGEEYRDWTLPKGHMEPGESREATAKREVKEETGLDIAIKSALPSRSYVNAKGKRAMAHFFLARSLDDSKLRNEPGFPGNRLEWVPIAEAESRLSFDDMKGYFRSVRNFLK